MVFNYFQISKKPIRYKALKPPYDNLLVVS